MHRLSFCWILEVQGQYSEAIDMFPPKSLDIRSFGSERQVELSDFCRAVLAQSCTMACDRLSASEEQLVVVPVSRFSFLCPYRLGEVIEVRLCRYFLG